MELVSHFSEKQFHNFYELFLCLCKRLCMSLYQKLVLQVIISYNQSLHSDSNYFSFKKYFASKLNFSAQTIKRMILLIDSAYVVFVEL